MCRITTVYGRYFTFTCPNVGIKHNVESGKLSGIYRYTVDAKDEGFLEAELRLGFAKINEWLMKNAHEPLRVPVVCGYAPVARLLWRRLRDDRRKAEGAQVAS